MGRKGISPLIAAVMLIAFVISIGGLFSQWSTTLVNDATQSNTETKDELLNCSKISLEFLEVNEDYSNNELNVTLKSSGGKAGNVTVRVSPSYNTKYVEMTSDGQIEIIEFAVSSQQDAVRADAQSCAVSVTRNLN